MSVRLKKFNLGGFLSVGMAKKASNVHIQTQVLNFKNWPFIHNKCILKFDIIILFLIN